MTAADLAETLERQLSLLTDDPEILGRSFESLMAAADRRVTGAVRVPEKTQYSYSKRLALHQGWFHTYAVEIERGDRPGRCCRHESASSISQKPGQLFVTTSGSRTRTPGTAVPSTANAMARR